MLAVLELPLMFVILMSNASRAAVFSTAVEHMPVDQNS